MSASYHPIQKYQAIIQETETALALLTTGTQEHKIMELELRVLRLELQNLLSQTTYPPRAL